MRGLFTHQSELYAIDGPSLVRIDSTGVRTTLASLNSAAGPVDFASTLSQLVIADGSFLYVWDGVNLNVAANYPGGNRIAFIDQRIVFDMRDSQRFGWTALGDASSINLLDFASAESSPDNLLAVTADHGEVWLFGVNTTEIWRSVGGTEVFSNTRNTIEFGTAAAHSVRKSANSLTWLARDENGQALVLSTEGYQPKRISTRAIEERFQGRDLSNASAYTYSDGSQHFYCLNVPGVDTTLVYDHAFKQWHERAEIVNGAYAQWRPNSHAFAYGRHYFSSAADANLYRLDENVHTYAGDPKVRSRVMPVIADPERARRAYPQVEVVCEKATAGTGMLRWSDDNGFTWSEWIFASTGVVGRYGNRLRWLRNGSGRDRVFEVRFTDNAPFNPVQSVIQVT